MIYEVDWIGVQNDSWMWRAYCFLKWASVMKTVICKDYKGLGLALMSNLLGSHRQRLIYMFNMSCFSFIMEEDFKYAVPLWKQRHPRNVACLKGKDDSTEIYALFNHNHFLWLRSSQTAFPPEFPTTLRFSFGPSTLIQSATWERPWKQAAV